MDVKNNRLFRIGCLFVVNIALFVLSAYFLPCMFEDNDDTTMVWIANGVYSGVPDYHLVFINALYGQCLAWLYSWIINVEWYSVLFAVWQIISITIIIDFLSRKISKKSIRWLGYGLFYCFWFLVIVRFQFTTTAAMLAFAGTLLLYDKRFLWGGLLLFIASLIRFPVMGLVGLIMVPILFSSFMSDFKKSFAYMALIFVFMIGALWANKLAYQSPEWKYYAELNASRGRINDNPNNWRIRDNLREGLSQTNYDLVCAFAMDPTQVTSKQLSAAAQDLSQTPLKKKLLNAYKFGVKRYYLWFVVFAFWTMLIFRSLANDCFKWIVVITYVLWVATILLISTNASAKFRVFLTSLLPMIFVTLCGLVQIIDRKQHYISLCLGVFPLALLITPIIKQSVDIRHHNAIIQEQMDLYKQRGNCKVVPDGADLSVEYLKPFTLYKVIEKQSFINPYCMAGSPLTPAYMSYKDFIDNNLCLFSIKPYDVDLRLKALKENYDIDAEVKVIAESKHYVLLKFYQKD